MLLSDLVQILDLCPWDKEVVVEIDGVHHPIQDVLDNSQGAVLIVVRFQEEREMR